MARVAKVSLHECTQAVRMSQVVVRTVCWGQIRIPAPSVLCVSVRGLLCT